MMIEDSIILATIRRNPGIDSYDILDSVCCGEKFDEINMLSLIVRLERLRNRGEITGDWMTGVFVVNKIENGVLQ